MEKDIVDVENAGIIYVCGKMETLKLKRNIIKKQYENNTENINTQQRETQHVISVIV